MKALKITSQVKSNKAQRFCAYFNYKNMLILIRVCAYLIITNVIRHLNMKVFWPSAHYSESTVTLLPKEGYLNNPIK